jgi:hypothetical protein
MICDPSLEPQWQPVRSKENTSYEVSDHASECLCVLLEKDVNERLSAEEALKEPWLRKARSLRKKYEAAGLLVQDADASELEIPMAVRLKAQRAAAKPLVPLAIEQSRTDTLLALKSSRATVSGGSKAKLAASRPTARAPAIPPRRNAREDTVDIDASMSFLSRIEALTTDTASRVEALTNAPATNVVNFRRT